jgi:N-acetylmuramic acid 6-phosphate etherase
MNGNGESHNEKAREFLRVAHLYKLGTLPTEQPHTRTRKLSSWAVEDLPRAVAVLKGVDLRALALMERYADGIDRLSRSVQATLDAGRTVFLCGCGATGRLSLSLEYLWREAHPGSEQVQSFMAGGDVALVHSLEGFEDYPEYGARHLEQMGFEDGDLLIACTEGGETPYVIGATERAAELSSNAPFFLYCNVDSALAGHVERFRRVRDNPKIEKVCLHVGPMALAGSTRMQASTVLQLAVGVALLQRGVLARDLIATYRHKVRETDFSFLAAFVEREADIYAAGDYVTYVVRDFGITVLTDTTERAPTFSLVPFDQLERRQSRHSLCYVALEDGRSAADAWTRLMNRVPRALDWPEVDPRTGLDYLRRFDFSAQAPAKRRRQLPYSDHVEFRVARSDSGGIALGLQDQKHEVPTGGMPGLLQHLLLKQMLNIHSTLVMGRLGRYEGNLMTWVSPTNGKLVDRAARYVGHLLDAAGRAKPGYADIVRQLFAEMEGMPPGEPVVLRAFRSLCGDHGGAGH